MHVQPISTAVSARSEAGAQTAPETRTLDGFVALHYRRLVRLASLVCVDSSEAQDAVQNALVRAWRSRDRLREASRMKPWLDAIVVRESIRLNDRRRSRLRRLVTPLVEAAAPPSAALSGTSLDLAAALRSMPAAQRAVVALHYEAGYSVAETAELMRVPHETVRSRLRLARQRLRRDLAEEGR